MEPKPRSIFLRLFFMLLALVFLIGPGLFFWWIAYLAYIEKGLFNLPIPGLLGLVFVGGGVAVMISNIRS